MNDLEPAKVHVVDALLFYLGLHGRGIYCTFGELCVHRHGRIILSSDTWRVLEVQIRRKFQANDVRFKI